VGCSSNEHASLTEGAVADLMIKSVDSNLSFAIIEVTVFQSRVLIELKAARIAAVTNEAAVFDVNGPICNYNCKEAQRRKGLVIEDVSCSSSSKLFSYRNDRYITLLTSFIWVIFGVIDELRINNDDARGLI